MSLPWPVHPRGRLLGHKPRYHDAVLPDCASPHFRGTAMTKNFWLSGFTPVIKAHRNSTAAAAPTRAWSTATFPAAWAREEREFLGERDSFYIASFGRHRMALRTASRRPQSFLESHRRTAPSRSPIFRQQQYISTGNLMTDNRRRLIMVDYPGGRLKILGRVESFEGEKPQTGSPISATGIQSHHRNVST